MWDVGGRIVMARIVRFIIHLPLPSLLSFIFDVYLVEEVVLTSCRYPRLVSGV